MGGRVGLLDLDVYGPSLPVLVKPEDVAVRRSPLGSGMVYPIEHEGVKLLSLGFVSSKVRSSALTNENYTTILTSILLHPRAVCQAVVKTVVLRCSEDPWQARLSHNCKLSVDSIVCET